MQSWGKFASWSAYVFKKFKRCFLVSRTWILAFIPWRIEYYAVINDIPKRHAVIH